jgi:hypothetical protein
MVRNQVAAEPFSKRVASAGNASEDSAHVHTDRLELLNSSQDPTELEQGADSPLTNYKAPENARIPTRGTDEWIIWNRLNAMGRDTGESYPLATGSPLLHLRIVHELIRTRLAAGMLRTALKLCHLHHVYTTTQKGGQKSFLQPSIARAYQTELAGAWCLYARIL